MTIFRINVCINSTASSSSHEAKGHSKISKFNCSLSSKTSALKARRNKKPLAPVQKIYIDSNNKKRSGECSQQKKLRQGGLFLWSVVCDSRCFGVTKSWCFREVSSWEKFPQVDVTPRGRVRPFQVRKFNPFPALNII